jgi:hypothetical protein
MRQGWRAALGQPQAARRSILRRQDLTFCVTSADVAGNTSTQCVAYSVLEQPTITVTSPIEPIYELGSLVTVEYSCSDAATCTAGVASGSPLDTSTPGLKSFTVTATDKVGNTTTQVVT